MSVIYIMYGGLILFFLYRQYKAYRARQTITGHEKHYFKKSISRFVIILGALVAVFGIYNIVASQYLAGALMVSLVVVMGLEYLDRIILTEEGIYGNGEFIEWKEIRKWAFSEDTHELILQYKREFKEEVAYIRVEEDQIEKINLLIRRYKLGK